MTDRLGQQIGNYRLARLLGKGGFAEVYLGEHIHLGTQAAIKILDARLAGDEVERFRQEARTIAHLKHPHIVRILDFDVEENTPFLVMDYAPGGTLRQRYPKGAQLAPLVILPYLQQIADALQYAHQHKLIHRDVKPENMLVGSAQEVLLSDFGIALLAQSSRQQRTQEIAGTAAYMAPEQLQGKPRPASDQYALGVILYEWLSGHLPFHGTFTEIASQHMLASPPSLRGKLPTLSPAVEAVVLTALAKDPHDRFATISAFAIAFESACLDQPARLVSPLRAAIASPGMSRSPGQGMESASVASPSPPAALASTLPAAPVPIPREGVSRRTFVLGLAGAALAAGGLTWLALAHNASGPSGANAPSPPGNTLGTTLFVYQQHRDIIYAVAWSPTGQRIASASGDATVQVWDATTGNHSLIYRGHQSSVDAVAWSPDGDRIVSGGPDAQVWQVAGGSRLYTYRGLTGVEGVAWSRDGRSIAAASDDRHVYVWDAASETSIFTYARHTDRVLAVAWSPNGQRIASTSRDGTVQIWDAATGENVVMYSGHSGYVTGVAWSPDGKFIASAGGDGQVHISDAISGAQVRIYYGHSTLVEGVAWSPDGRYIVSGSRDMTAQVWDARSGETLLTYRGHNAAVWAVAWSPESRRVASGSADRTVRVWQAV